MAAKILITPHPRYMSEESRPDQAHYSFAYTIEIENQSPQRVQLLERHWIITDANGQRTEVQGPGVVGDDVLAEQVEIQVKYEGYIARQQDEIEKQQRNENTVLPATLDYRQVTGLSNEVIAKLNDHKPASIGQASRISGITPAAISILLVWLKKQGLLRRSA